MMFAIKQECYFRIRGLNMAENTMTPYMACAIAEGFCEGEGASEEEQIEAWQYLIDTGLC